MQTLTQCLHDDLLDVYTEIHAIAGRGARQYFMPLGIEFGANVESGKCHLSDVARVDIGAQNVARDASHPLHFQHSLSRNALEAPVIHRLARNSECFGQGGRASDCLGGDIDQFGGVVLHTCDINRSDYLSKPTIYKSEKSAVCPQNKPMIDKRKLVPSPLPSEVPDPKHFKWLEDYLKALLEAVPRLTPADLGRAMGGQRQDVHGYLNEGKLPSPKKLETLAKWTGKPIYEALLVLRAHGKKIESEEPMVRQVSMDSFSDVNRENRVVDIFRNLTPEAQAALELVAKTLPKKAP